ncbi:MAG: hypothetical protein ACR2NK_17355 [Mariniblastus sp.]
MRFLFELGVFFSIFVCAVVLCACVFWLVGSPLELEFRASIAFSFISLAIILPSIANFWIMFRGTGGESMSERLLSGLRGFGMLICAITLFVAIATKSLSFAAGASLLVIGSILWWGTVPVELLVRQRQINSSTGTDV